MGEKEKVFQDGRGEDHVLVNIKGSFVVFLLSFFCFKTKIPCDVVEKLPYRRQQLSDK